MKHNPENCLKLNTILYLNQKINLVTLEKNKIAPKSKMTDFNAMSTHLDLFHG